MQKEEIYFTTDKYSNLTDEQIITDIKNGDEQALVYLLNKYKDLVNSKVGKYFIIGADSLFTLNTWYKPDYICANCHILAANRDEHPLDELIKRRDWLIDKYNAHIDLISCDDYPFSSTFIRDEAAAGHNISPFVGNAVAGYIADNGLYNKKFFTA